MESWKRNWKVRDKSDNFTTHDIVASFFFLMHGRKQSLFSDKNKIRNHGKFCGAKNHLKFSTSQGKIRIWRFPDSLKLYLKRENVCYTLLLYECMTFWHFYYKMHDILQTTSTGAPIVGQLTYAVMHSDICWKCMTPLQDVEQLITMLLFSFRIFIYLFIVSVSYHFSAIIFLLFRRWIIKVVYGKNLNLSKDENLESKIFLSDQHCFICYKKNFFVSWITLFTFPVSGKNILTLHNNLLHSPLCGDYLGRNRKAAGPAENSVVSDRAFSCELWS